MTNHFVSDVSIVGSGFFACFTALLLAEQNYSVTLLTNNKPILSSVTNSLSVLWPTLNDPPTRADNAHGHEVACYLNDFCHFGIEFFKTKYQNLFQNFWFEVPCLRVGIQNFEMEELEKAKQLGFGLASTNNKNIYQEKNSAYICKNIPLFQKEVEQLILSKNIQIISDKLEKVEENQTGCEIFSFSDKSSNKISSELVVFANGHQISKFLPKFKPILIPMSDILFEYTCSSSKKISPVVLRASNGHIAVSIYQESENIHLKVTGPRFMLPQAGVGLILKREDITNQVLQNLRNFHNQIFNVLSIYYAYSSTDEFLIDFPFQFNNYYLSDDCYPCDELPLLGEFGKFGKILGGTGFLATGFSAGIWSAKIIDDLISKQDSQNLHSRLKPRRLQKILSY
jgi:glycine/D-amino acid oxidase-like deaminating enzyme